MNYQAGTQVVTKQGQILGTLTEAYNEGGQWFGVINNDYELTLAGSSLVLDLMGTCRAQNPALQAYWLEVQ
jgi:hypothetical protein